MSFTDIYAIRTQFNDETFVHEIIRHLYIIYGNHLLRLPIYETHVR
jgi:hypothetical protein